MTKVYLALLHYPMVNKKGDVVTTSVTNMDLHDLSRSCRTYEVEKYFVVTPIDEQHEIVRRIVEHWTTSPSRFNHPDRTEAFSRLVLKKTIEEVVIQVEEECGEKPELVMPDARALEKSMSYSEYRKKLENPSRTKPSLILLGTGWGIHPDYFEKMDVILEPLYGPRGKYGYNHLSVRAAGAVILDRLLG